MSIEVKGILVNFEYRRSGTSDPFKHAVCVLSSNQDITVEVAKRATNCGRKGAPGIPDSTVSLEAVQNANPGATETNYQDIKSFIINGYKADYRYASYADSASGLGYGDGIYNYGSGYFSRLGAAASAEDGEVLTYSVEFSPVGSLDNFDTSS